MSDPDAIRCVELQGIKAGLKLLPAMLFGGALAVSSVPAGAQPFMFGFSGGFGSAQELVTDVGTLDTSTSQFDPGIDNQGWWSATFANGDANDNYFVGEVSPSVLNDFFTFDLAGLTGSATSAALRVPAFGTDFGSATSLTYSLFDVTTDAATLNANDGTSAAIFSDLGSGILYGSITVTPGGGVPDPVVVSLNAAAIGAINARRTQCGTSGSPCYFSIGGTLSTTQVPEPASLALFGIGMAGLGAMRRRKA